jgi:ABC-type uncharacterized transport system involved in gliding motility auxiliary subunit
MKRYTLWLNIGSLIFFIASLISYGAKGEWFWLSWLLLIISILSLGFSYYLNWKNKRDRKDKHSINMGVNAATNIMFVLALIALLSFITTRRHKRFDVTSEKLFSMADQTVNVMKQLDKRVKAYVFIRKQEQGPIKDLLDEYKYLSDKFDYEIVDPNKKPVLAKQYNIDQYGQAVFLCQDRRQKIDKVDEPNVTNAILKVSQDKVYTVYFMTGHGEKNITDKSPAGYEEISKFLKDENYQVKTLNLMKDKNFPEDCDVLVIAAPQSPYFPAEIDSIETYLNQGGSVVLLADFMPALPDNLRDFAARRGINIGKGIVLDQSPIGQLLGFGPAVPLVQDYQPHKITRKLNQVSFFPRVVNLSKNDTVKSYTVQSLLKTGPQTWAETNINSRELKYDEGKDVKGPIPVGMIAEKELKDKKSILVVYGDADFISNQFVRNGANRDLFQNTINYVSGAENLISVRPKKMNDRRITMSQKQSKMVLVSVILLPLLIVVAGFVVYFRRRK